MSDIDSLLDSTLDDIADLPEFKVFPAGAYKVAATFTQKKIGDNDAIELSLKLLEVVELADPQDTPPVAGDVSSTAFMLNNEFGLGNFKKCAVPFGSALALSSMRDIIEGVKDIECMVITSVRTDKKDKDKHYLNVKEIQVL